MNTYTIYWKTGDREIVRGYSPVNGLSLAGYGRGAFAALDFWADGDDHNYIWDKEQKAWIRITQ